MSSEEIQKINARLKLLEVEVFKDTKCGGTSFQSVLEFDPKILMEHQWKGKKLGHRHWADGSLNWGWDFIAEFPEEVIAVLEKGPLIIEGSVFTLGEKVVNVKKEGVK